MDERILEELENVPSSAEDDFKQLKELANFYADEKKITKVERERLNYELNLIKTWGIAKVYLFGYNLCFNENFATTCGIYGNSYVNYLLGVTSVNPVLYNLPFERFFNEHRKFLPTYNICVLKGKEGIILKAIYDKYGKNCVIKSKEDDENYFISSKPINSELIKERRIVAKLNEESYQEKVSMLTCMELIKLGFYSFIITEVSEIKYSEKESFSEVEIYEKTKELFTYRTPDIPAFTDIKAVKEILAPTEYKLIYQEQLMEILNKVCVYDMATADHLRREICKRKKESLTGLQKILFEKHGVNGQKFFDYLYQNVRYTVSKAYVIASLHNLIEF